MRVLGLVIGFFGVPWLAWDKGNTKPSGTGGALLACLAGPLCYGASANFTKRYLAGVPPLAVAAGSQLGASLALAVPAALWWPAAAPSNTTWAAAAMLAVLCTGFAYLLYFRLIASVGPAKAIAVTFLVPGFAVLWGVLLLGETMNASMLTGCVVILVGTSLTTGLLRIGKRA